MDNKDVNKNDIEFKIEELTEEIYKQYVPSHNVQGRTWRKVSVMYPDWTHAIFWKRQEADDWFLFRLGQLEELENFRDSLMQLTGKGLTDHQFLESLKKMLAETSQGGFRNFG